MGLLTFKGGIHPDDGKRFSKDQPIRRLLPEGELVYPLSQHIGAPANPLVKKGDRVLKGQMIAAPGGYVSAPVHASVSGTVKGLEQRFSPSGTKTECIVIENDGSYEEMRYEAVKSLSDMTREEILDRIGDSGIVGMGGAGFPTRIKLSPKEPEKILILHPASTAEMYHHNAQIIFFLSHLFSNIKFRRTETVLMVSDKPAIQPQPEAAFHTLKIDPDSFAVPSVRKIKHSSVYSRGIILFRNFRRMDILNPVPRVLSIYILRTSIPLHLHMTRNTYLTVQQFLFLTAHNVRIDLVRSSIVFKFPDSI